MPLSQQRLTIPRKYAGVGLGAHAVSLIAIEINSGSMPLSMIRWIHLAMGIGIPDPNTLFQSSQIVRQYSDTPGSVCLVVAVVAAAAADSDAAAPAAADSAPAAGSGSDCCALP